MANPEHIKLLKKGAKVWNEWRDENTHAKPDVSGANLSYEHLKNVNLSDANIRGTNFKGANLEKANFCNAEGGVNPIRCLIQCLTSLLCGLSAGYLSAWSSRYFFKINEENLKLLDIDFNTIQAFVGGMLVFIIAFIMLVFSIKRNKILVFAGVGFLVLALTARLPLYLAMIEPNTSIWSVVKFKGLAWGFTESVTGTMFIGMIVLISLAGALAVPSLVSCALSLAFGWTIAWIVSWVGSTVFGMVGALSLAAPVFVIASSVYIAHCTYKENEQFFLLRKLGLSYISFGGTNFKDANLNQANFNGACLGSTYFNGNENMVGTIWKDTRKTEMACFFDTILENTKVRNLLVSLDGKEQIFNSLNLKGVYLRVADLRGSDFRDTDLRNADLSMANITGIKLHGTSREDWIIDSVECDYVFMGENGKERRPEKNNFKPGEFEELYKNISAIDENLIERFIEFPPEYHQAGISILNYFGTVLKKKYPDTKARIIIEQEDLKVKMIIDPQDGRDREIIEKTLTEYGLVVTGNMKPEEFTDDKLLLIELKNELRMARFRVETQKEMLLDKSAQIDTLLSIVGSAVQKQPEINVNQKVTGGDTIDINADGDVTFAKDRAMAQINKTVTEAANIPEALTSNLRELMAAVENMVGEMAGEKAEEIFGDLRALADEISKAQPRKKWCELSAEGLISAAKLVGTSGKQVIESARAVVELLD